jgi:hypothetical protein
LKFVKSQARLRSSSGRDPETLVNRRLRLHTNQTVYEFAVLEDEHSGYARDLKTRSYLRVVIDIQFRYSILPLRLGGKLVHNRSDDPARTTPRRPTINQHRPSSRSQHFALESLIRNHQRLRFLFSAGGRNAFQFFSTAATLRLAMGQAGFIHTVLRFTVTANDNYLHKGLFFLFLEFDSPLIAKVSWSVSAAMTGGSIIAPTFAF